MLLFYEMYPLSSVDYNKECIQIIIIIIYFLSRGSVLSFGILHVQIFIQYNILGAIQILWKWPKMLAVAGNKKKKAGRRRVHLKCIFTIFVSFLWYFLRKLTMDLL